MTNETTTLLQGIIERLDEVLQNMNASAILNERREKDRKRKADARGQKNVHGQKNVRGQERNEDEREEIPPTPPKGEKAEEKKDHTHTPRAREFPTFERALAYAISKLSGANVPREAVEDWYTECEMAGWKTKDGNDILNWGRDLCLHIRYWRKLKAEREPKSNDPRRSLSNPTSSDKPSTASLSRMDYSKIVRKLEGR